MEFQTNKGTLMLSSVSANIITQLGYLRNYAMEGHFFFYFRNPVLLFLS